MSQITEHMLRTIRYSVFAAILGLAGCDVVLAANQTKLRLGMMVTLSGSSSVLGTQTRDGFQLALNQLGGRLGGREV